MPARSSLTMALPLAPLPAPDEHRPGHGGRPPGAGGGPRIESLRIAVILLLATETMFFTGLVGAYLVLRFGAVPGAWPPADQPRLPLAVTALNSLVLLASGVTMARSLRAGRRGDRPGLRRGLGLTLALGGLFLAVQGGEWARLLAHGLTLGSSLYGATFYTLIGCHGLHVVAAAAWLAVVHRRAAGGAYDGRLLGVELCATYWYFVVALWGFLFPLVYLV